MNNERQKLLEAVKTIRTFCETVGKCRACPMHNNDNGNCLIDRTIWNIDEIERRLKEAENDC